MRQLKKYIIITAMVFGVWSCSSDDTMNPFQENRPQPQFRLYNVLDETPAIKSLFSDVDPYTFNILMDRLVRQDPELAVILMRNSASTFYGDPGSVVFPLMVQDLSESFTSFYNSYEYDKDRFELMFDTAEKALFLDPDIMSHGAGTLSGLLSDIRNVEEYIQYSDDIPSELEKKPVVRGTVEIWVDGTLYAKDNGFGDIIGVSDSPISGTIDYFTGELNLESGRDSNTRMLSQAEVETRYSVSGDDNWNLFSEGQILDGMGYSGIASFINFADIAADFYSREPDPDDKSAFLLSLFHSLQDSPMGVEATMEDIVNILSDEEFAENEKAWADWLIADRDKVAITHYAIDTLYPMMLDPVFKHANVPDDFHDLHLPYYIQTEENYQNFIRRGRWLLDDTVFMFTATPAKLSGNSADSNEQFLRSFLWGFSKDMWHYDRLEEVPVFDFENNELLAWSDTIVSDRLNPAVGVIDKPRFRNVLWDGWFYNPTGGGSSTYIDGIFRVGDSDENYIHADDGYVARMAKTRSSDNVDKPFRVQMDEILNTGWAGEGNFKDINMSYADTGESQIEAIFTNLQLYLLSHYYSPEHRKWAFTPEDGENLFGDSSRNLQELYGNMSTSLRNITVLDKEGRHPEDGGNDIPMLAELMYVIAAGYGIVDPENAPGELSLRNCLKSMGSEQLGYQEKNYISVNGGIFGTFNIPVLGSNQTKRRPHGGNAVTFATQPGMSAMELLQPGTFRERTGLDHVGSWQGSFSGSQGDIIGIQNENGDIVTTNWTLTEVALAAWQGYGPYTYKGRAPNGSECKYENYWYTDEYRIYGHAYGQRGPGMGNNYSRYKIYEKIHKTSPDSEYGYLRQDGTDYYKNPEAYGEKIRLDCSTREEAIRKNFNWLMNEKKYVFLIPMHAYLDQKVWGGLAGVQMEMFVYASINANGIMGITRARRFQEHGDIRDNAIWPGEAFDGSGFSYNTNEEISTSKQINIRGASNTVLAAVPDGNNSYRYKAVSFKNQDFMVALDYTYDYSASALGFLPIPPRISEWIMNSIVNIPSEIWGCLGDGSVLPPSVGENFDSVANLGSIVYTKNDLLANPGQALNNNMSKFRKFYDEYYSDAGLFNGSTQLVKDSELPPVPRVKGVTYPTEFNEGGYAISWEEHKNGSKGKFEDILGIFAASVGTIHEDGDIYADISGNTPAGYDQRNTGDFAYFARDGFRANMDNLAMLAAALNEHKKGSNSNLPVYNPSAWVNIMVDHNGSSVVPGSREGTLPALLSSRYFNINNPGPAKEGIEDAVRHTIRSYLNYFDITRGYVGINHGTHGAPCPSTWDDLESYYELDHRGNKIPDGRGYYLLNPDLDWNIPINRFRYLTSDRSIDQVERILDYVRDLSYDEGTEERPEFRELIRKSVTAINLYLRINYMESNPNSDPSGAAYLNVTEEDIDKAIDLIQNLDYGRIFEYIKENDLNDIAKFYNFKLDDWLETASPGELQQIVDELNTNLVKVFGINIKEGLINGVYKISEDAWTGDIPDGFEPGEIVYGYGKYIPIEHPGNTQYGGISVEDEDGNCYEYVDIKNKIKTDTNQIFKTQFAGLIDLFDFKSLGETEFEPYGTEYYDIWYRGELERCPNIYNFHNYDIRMDRVMDSYNKVLLSLTGDLFDFDKPFEEHKLGKNGSVTYNRPSTVIDWLYNIDLKTEMNFIKDLAFNQFFDKSTMTMADPSDSWNEKEKSPRKFVELYRDFLTENVFEYEYTRGGETKTTAYYGSPEDERLYNDGHIHLINSVLELASTFFDSRSEKYITGELYTFWEDLMLEAQRTGIKPENLSAARDSGGSLLFDAGVLHAVNDGKVWIEEPFNYINMRGEWASDAPYADLQTLKEWKPDDYEGENYDPYTGFLSKLTGRLPDLMAAFDGYHEDLIQVMINTFEPGSLGDYLLNSMKADSRYDMLDFVEEFNMLVNQDIFKEFQRNTSFWWQMGSLLDSMAIRIESSPGYPDLDYHDRVADVFR